MGAKLSIAALAVGSVEGFVTHEPAIIGGNPNVWSPTSFDVNTKATFFSDVHVPSGLLAVARQETGYGTEDHSSGYPVIDGERTRPSWPMQTASGLTSTRMSDGLYADMKKGFGADLSFQTSDSGGNINEIGVIGGEITGHLTADGKDMSELVFKTWSGADHAGYEGDADGKFNRLTIGEDYTKYDTYIGVSHGSLNVKRQETEHTSGYPVIDGERTRPTWPAQTASGLTSTRVSDGLYADMQPGFGADVSFQTSDSEGNINEVGVIGGEITGHLTADGKDMSQLVFKTWSGADHAGYEGDVDGKFNRLVAGEHYTKHDTYVGIPAGELSVTRIETGAGTDQHNTGYPVTVGTRERPSWPMQTASALTSRRHSDLAAADYSAGFGPDVSFETTDSTGEVHELGAIGMAHSGACTGGTDASALNSDCHGEILFKVWDGADYNGYDGDAHGDYTVVKMMRNDVHINGVSFNALLERVNALSAAAVPPMAEIVKPVVTSI